MIALRALPAQHNKRFRSVKLPPLLTAIVTTAICTIPVLVRLVFFPDYPGTDDSFIHAAVIESLRAGHGWGINPGESVNLSTSPVFTILMLAVSYAFPNVIAAGTALGCVVVTLAIFLTYKIAAEISTDARIAITSAFLAAANIHLWRWTGTFIETTFAYTGVLIVLYVFRAIYEGRSNRVDGLKFFSFGLCVGVLALLRYECGLLGVAFFLHHASNDRCYIVRRYIVAGAGLFTAMMPWAIFAILTFGTIMPTTVSAKVSTGLVFWNPEILRTYATVWGSGAGISLAILAFAFFTLSKPELGNAFKHSVIFLAFPLLVFSFYYFKTHGLQSPARYLLPSMATIPLLAAVFLSQLRSNKLTTHIALAGTAAQFIAAVVLIDLRIAPVLSGMRTGYIQAMTEATEQLARYCQTGDSVLAEIDIGVISYENRSKCRIADGGALASPELRGLSVNDQIDVIKPAFVIETLGGPQSELAASNSRLSILWEKKFRSHSVEMPDKIFTVRLFKLD